MKKGQHKRYEKPIFNAGDGLNESMWDLGTASIERRKAFQKSKKRKKRK